MHACMVHGGLLLWNISRVHDENHKHLMGAGEGES